MNAVIQLPLIDERYIRLVERVMRRVVLNEVTGCWIWQGALGGNSRPVIKVTVARKEAQLVYVARLMLAIKLGRPLLPGKLAEHDCDVGLCVCMDHLREGSYSSNLRAAWCRRRRSCRPSTLTDRIA
jgi:hypothetical protein